MECDVETKEINKLLDDIQGAKTEIQKLGRTVFRLSSLVAELSESDKMAIRSSLDKHPLFENEQVIFTKIDEFYKASVGYIELLRDLNVQVVNLSGKPNLKV